MWALILHGGAKEIEPEEETAHRRGCLAALAAGRAVLQGSGSAVDAVEASLRVLEADPTFNAGFGSALNADGEVEMCSALMEGGDFNVGGVSIIKGVRHPISVAKAMLYDDPILIAGEGARRYAVEHGLELCDPGDLIAPEDRPEAARTRTHDTVGCVALDEAGTMAVGTSTGGLDGSPAGRVGDSPQPGCGFYVDNGVGGVAFSGDGEQIARKTLAARVMHMLDAADPHPALAAALEHVAAIDGEAGGIALTPTGRFGWLHNSRDFAIAFQSSEIGNPRVFMRKGEEK